MKNNMSKKSTKKKSQLQRGYSTENGRRRESIWVRGIYLGAEVIRQNSLLLLNTIFHYFYTFQKGTDSL